MLTRKRLALVALAVICAAAMIATAIMLVLRWSLPRTQRITAIECMLATGEVLSVERTQTWHRWSWGAGGASWLRDLDLWLRSRAPTYECFLSWRKGRRHRTYLIADGSSRYSRLQLQGKADGTGVWVRDLDRPDSPEVIGSLDLRTGECRDWNQMTVEGRGTIPIRVDPNAGGQGYPGWATVDGGVLLGRWEEPAHGTPE